MTQPETALQPRRKRLTRRQRRGPSRGVQYVVLVAAVIAFAVAADWDRLRNQLTQRALAEHMFPK